MKKFIASSDKTEVNGETVNSFLDGMGNFRYSAEYALRKFGITNVSPGKWYKQQSFLNAIKEISEKMGCQIVYLIGTRIPYNAKFESSFKSIHEALEHIDVAYKINHRNGEIGHYKYEMTSEFSGKMTCSGPYPDTLDRGIITSTIIKTNISKNPIRVIADESIGTRERGQKETVFLISW